MSGSSLEGRYAKALFELAEKKKTSDKVEADLVQLLKAIADSSALDQAIKNPAISKTSLLKVVAEILKKQGADKLTSDFVGVLVQNGRVRSVGQVVNAYSSLMREARGEEKAYVTTASSLDKKQVEELEKTLGKALSNRIKAEVSVNESIIGGMIVRIGSKMLDASISGQLEKLAILNKKAIAELN